MQASPAAAAPLSNACAAAASSSPVPAAPPPPPASTIPEEFNLPCRDAKSKITGAALSFEHGIHDDRGGQQGLVPERAERRRCNLVGRLACLLFVLLLVAAVAVKSAGVASAEVPVDDATAKTVAFAYLRPDDEWRFAHAGGRVAKNQNQKPEKERQTEADENGTGEQAAAEKVSGEATAAEASETTASDTAAAEEAAAAERAVAWFLRPTQTHLPQA